MGRKRQTKVKLLKTIAYTVPRDVTLPAALSSAGSDDPCVAEFCVNVPGERVRS